MSKKIDKLSDDNPRRIAQAKEELQKAIEFLKLLDQENIIFDNLLKEPEPDVKLLNQINNSAIGMELVSLNIDKIKPLEFKLRNIVEHARVIFEEKSNPIDPICVTISFSKSGELKLDPDNGSKIIDKCKHEIINDLVSIITKYEKSISKGSLLEINKVFDFDSKYIDRISISKTFMSNFWSLSGGTVVPPIQNVNCGNGYEEDLIQKYLDKKSDKPKNYKSNYEELWLLIYAKENRNSTLFTLDRFDYNKIYKSPYDKVYLMLENRIELINTNK